MRGYRIKDLQQEERPREKIIELGPKNLTDVELLAIILGTGGKDSSAIQTSRIILNKYNGLEGLQAIELNKLLKIKYVGIAKATKLIALGEIGLRMKRTKQIQKPQIKDPKDLYTLLRPNIYGIQKETLYLVSLDTRNRLLSKDIITVGTINETLVHPREIYIKALEKQAVYIILAHNHPSQDTEPSKQDLAVTTRIAKAGITLGVPLLDHVILSDHTYTSIKKDYLSDLTKLETKGGDIS